MNNEKLKISFLLVFFLAFSSCLFFCRFQSSTAAYAYRPGETSRIRYSSSLEAVSGPARRDYAAGAEALLVARASAGAAKDRFELVVTVDSLAFRGSDRDAEENRYMADRLRKYRARLALAASGQVLALEEEPGLPPVEFSTLNFGRWLLYALPAFPAEAIGDGSRWTVEQPLLDKFHPGSKVVKNCRATSLRKTEAGRILTVDYEVTAHLVELGEGEGGPDHALTAFKGKGEALFNLDKGVPVSVSLDLKGDFLVPAPASGPGSPPGAERSLRLKESLKLQFRNQR